MRFAIVGLLTLAGGLATARAPDGADRLRLVFDRPDGAHPCEVGEREHSEGQSGFVINGGRNIPCTAFVAGARGGYVAVIEKDLNANGELLVETYMGERVSYDYSSPRGDGSVVTAFLRGRIYHVWYAESHEAVCVSSASPFAIDALNCPNTPEARQFFYQTGYVSSESHGTAPLDLDGRKTLPYHLWKPWADLYEYQRIRYFCGEVPEGFWRANVFTDEPGSRGNIVSGLTDGCLESIPRALKDLPAHIDISLSRNKISILPNWLQKVDCSARRFFIVLDGNPLGSIPEFANGLHADARAVFCPQSRSAR